MVKKDVKTSEQKIEVFDRKALRQVRRRAQASSKDDFFLHSWAEKQIADRLLDINRSYDFALQFGMRNDSSALKSTKKIKTLLRTDNINHPNTSLICDEEFLPIKPASLDLAISVLNLHSINDLPGALLQLKKSLKPDGLFVAALLGGETLHELRDSLSQTELKMKNGISPRIFPFADKQQMGALLQRAGFSLPVVDSDIITVTYENMFKLMHDLRSMGESNIIFEREKKNPGKAFFMNAAQYYAGTYGEDTGRITASFEIIFLTGWAPHENQQKPLHPGSARHKLADALESVEIKTGEKATP